jgi:hypothetical protein
VEEPTKPAFIKVLRASPVRCWPKLQMAGPLGLGVCCTGSDGRGHCQPGAVLVLIHVAHGVGHSSLFTPPSSGRPAWCDSGRHLSYPNSTTWLPADLPLDLEAVPSGTDPGTTHHAVRGQPKASNAQSTLAAEVDCKSEWWGVPVPRCVCLLQALRGPPNRLKEVEPPPKSPATPNGQWSFHPR